MKTQIKMIKIHIIIWNKYFAPVCLTKGFWCVPFIPWSLSNPRHQHFTTELSCRIFYSDCQPSRLQKAFPLANEQSLHPIFKSTKCYFHWNAFPSLCHPTRPLPPPQPCRNWTMKWRYATQTLIHLKLTGRPDYGGCFLLQTSYRRHLYRNTCRNMKVLPSSISLSIVCRICQQTKSKLSYAHLSHRVYMNGRIQTNEHTKRMKEISHSACADV